MNDWSFLTADNEELNEALEGRTLRPGYPWPRSTGIRANSEREVGVLSATTQLWGLRRPIALVVSDEIARRLFGRYAQLRSDLSPLSVWCHILDWDHFEQLESVTREPDLSGFEASWIGLTVAEALILSDRSLSSLKFAACLATQSYALGRSVALWPREKLEDVLTKYDQCQKSLRPTDGTASHLRSAFIDIWRTLVAVSSPMAREAPTEIRKLVTALIQLRSARSAGVQESDDLYPALRDLPQAQFLQKLSGLTPEDRVREFDRLVAAIDAVPERERGRRNELQFLAGYLVTIVAGGAPSLSLADELSRRLPQIAAWAYVIGSVGERVTWTSGFDGLGRLVARELMRPLRLDDPPTCDFALDEAAVLIDRALQDPLVHLRVKQSRVISVALYPGVNVFVPIFEAPQDHRARETPQRTDARSNHLLPALADALWPYLESRIKNVSHGSSEPPRRGGKPGLFSSTLMWAFRARD